MVGSYPKPGRLASNFVIAVTAARVELVVSNGLSVRERGRHTTSEQTMKIETKNELRVLGQQQSTTGLRELTDEELAGVLGGIVPSKQGPSRYSMKHISPAE
jgi:hypothetical protein